MNSVFLSGNLTKDVLIEQFTTQDNRTATRALTTIAVDGEWDRRTNTRKATFVPLIIWGSVAEAFAQRCKKGTKVQINGRLDVGRYQDASGNYQNYAQVIVDSFEDFAYNNAMPPQSNVNTQVNNAPSAPQMAPAANVQPAPVAPVAPVQPAPVPAAVEEVNNPAKFGYIGDDEPVQYKPKPLPTNKIW